ncbi:Na+/H+ antiporter NhaC family protein [Romboutsia lituseburensis]|uniref:Na+/H+ antiporter NhaC family protein n=1 Tax=Romboutsia lituseburensis TaxID=1537 RepID=UPI00215ACBDA|nr:Na+/H+ antiporter NhaC family protein [Romboutsia lituseburensis]MCR8743936.1 Na+/H+ antiporter NhaC family protein [Romboutsia lituseburensis]
MGFWVGLFKFSPVFVLAGLMMFKVDCLIAAPIATIYAFIVASITDKFKFNDLVDCAVDNVKELNLVFFILMLAYAMAEAFMSTGVGASLVNIALSLGVTGRTVAVVSFLVTAVLSVATGTSWGTFAACAPIFLWLNHMVGGNILLTTASIAGGACFGDNIGLISDTTVVSSGIQDVEVIDRIKSQGPWSLICLAITVVAIFVLSVTMGLPTEATNASAAINQIPPQVMIDLEAARPSAVELLNQVKEGVPYYMAIPLILVLVVAIKGLPTLVCLSVGIASSFLLGSFAGTVGSLNEFLKLMMGGFKEAGSWVIVMMMWVGAFGGIMSKMKAFEPLSNLVMYLARSVKQLMAMNGLLCLAGNAALADEMAQIVTVGPIIKELVEKNVDGSEEDLYQLRLRNATFSSSLGVFGSQLIPWHVYIGFYVGILSAVYPLHQFVATDIIKYNIMAFVTVGSILLLTLTGLDRFIPKFGLPSEPQVKLKKKEKHQERNNAV